ncbi:MAG TPA: type II toxin-antitoxin system HicB family antitoxin [Candidatus Limnocylindrales bacterium]|nr:type II toxin-antitoxin system HicB family antitoxin [Candidatus Limnocylindrales bacterium]
MRSTYTVTADRDGAWWAIRVVELPGVFSQARRLTDVERMARDAIALFNGVTRDSFDLTVQERITPDADAVVVEARMARAEAVESQRVASKKSREAAEALARLGLPQRDIGRILGLSHQRVAQLLRARG